VLPESDKIVISEGFFVNSKKATGSIKLMDSQTGRVQKISTDKQGYFYHHAEWFDMNGDGRQDIVTARVMKPLNPFQKAQAELLWLESPKQEGDQWTEHVLIEGPDVAFTKTDLNSDGVPEFVVTQFFSAKQLSVFVCGEKLWSHCNQDNIRQYIIDDQE